MFGVDLDKVQSDMVPSPDDQPEGVIVSPDTRRAKRVPPGQSRTRKWPVLDASGPPRVTTSSWKIKVFGLVNEAKEWSWQDFLNLPRIKVFADFHCVTRWSRLGNLWEGVPTAELVKRCGGLKPEARYVLAHGDDYGWTTNMPLEHFLAGDALVAVAHDGEQLALEHGGPARLIVPQLYAWKSAKWLGGVEFLAHDQPGFWERNGYHMHGDPWKEERHSWD
jgi:DMSO/TMAO reductase YedYZ molybdopterin-dependent catalytic subunit